MTWWPPRRGVDGVPEAPVRADGPADHEHEAAMASRAVSAHHGRLAEASIGSSLLAAYNKSFSRCQLHPEQEC